MKMKFLKCFGLLGIALSSLISVKSNQENLNIKNNIQHKEVSKVISPNGLTIQEYLKANWDARIEEFDVSSYNLTWDELTSIVFKFHRENPEYFFIMYKKGFVDENKDGIVEKFLQEYELDRKDELEEEWLLLNEKMQYCQTDLEKVICAHEHICENTRFFFELGSKSHDIEGAILEKRAVCEGYALSLKYYLNRAGVPCKTVGGNIIGGEAHAWNQVLIDGKWYFVDPTHDDTREPKLTKHKYLLVSENVLSKTHAWNRDEFELCTDTRFDNAFWQNINYEMVPYKGKIYHSNFEMFPEATFGIYEFDVLKDSIEQNGKLLIKNEEFWPLGGQEVTFALMAPSVYNDTFYYSVPKGIKKYDFITKTTSDVYTVPQNSEDYIWDINTKNGKLYFDDNPTKKGIREYNSIVIDPNFKKKKQPIDVSFEKKTISLSGDTNILFAAAPGNITYTSLNSDILTVTPTFEDYSCSLNPLKEGVAKIKLTAAETDRFEPVEKIIEVTVNKAMTDIYVASDKCENLNGKVVLSGTTYINRKGTGTNRPTGNLKFNVSSSGVTLLSSDVIYNFDTNGYVDFRIEVPSGKEIYELNIQYDGDANFGANSFKKEYFNKVTHVHAFTEEKIDPIYLVKGPTCTGGSVYFKSCKCGEKGSSTFTLNDSLGHEFKEPIWTWNAENTRSEATFKCGRANCNHEETLVATISKITKTDSTCVKEGVATLTSEVTFKNKKYTNSKEIKLPLKAHVYENGVCKNCGAKEEILIPHVHQYNEPTWKWNNDNSKVEASFICKDANCKHEEVVLATVKEEIKLAATCENKGSKVLIAKVTFNNSAYETRKEVEIPALNHVYENGTCIHCGKKENVQETVNNTPLIIGISIASLSIIAIISWVTILFIKKNRLK